MPLGPNPFYYSLLGKMKLTAINRVDIEHYTASYRVDFEYYTVSYRVEHYSASYKMHVLTVLQHAGAD